MSRLLRARKVCRSCLHGMTLAELLVVLVILAALAMVATRALAPVAEQARYDATRQTLDNIRAAILGDTTAASAVSGALGGFVADTGRLPVALEELLVQPADVPVFGLSPAPAPHGDVLVPRGWRGPYVRLPVGAGQVQDGWGSGLVFDPLSIPGGLVVASPGVTRPRSTPGYTADIGFQIASSDWHAALITGSLYKLDGGQKTPPSSGTWQVSLLGPGTVADGGVGVASATVTTTMTGDVTYSLSGSLPIGPRILRASKSGVAVGPPVYLTVRPGATHVIDLHVE